jgi:ribosomal protein S18 acetylase RimI-like enzyme
MGNNMDKTMVKIREAEQTDVESIRELIEYLMKVEETDDVEWNTETIMRDRIIPSFGSETSKTFVATLDEKIVGAQLVEIKNNLVASLAYIAVAPDHQGSGIGSKLIKASEEYAKNKGIHIVQTIVHKDNEKSKEFHEKLGYEFFGYVLRKEI